MLETLDNQDYGNKDSEAEKRHSWTLLTIKQPLAG